MKLKIDLNSVYSTFWGYEDDNPESIASEKNYKYFRRHYDEFKELIIQLKINREKMNKRSKDETLFCRCESIVNGRHNTTTIYFEDDGTFKNCKCDCGFNSTWEPCGHVLMLANYCNEMELEYPYEYKHPYVDMPYKIYDDYIDILEFRNKVAKNENWLSNLLISDVIDELNSERDEKISLNPELVYENKDYRFEFPRMKFKIGFDKMYVIKNIFNDVLLPLENKDIVKFGKTLRFTMEEDAFDDFSKKQLEMLTRLKDELRYDLLPVNKTTIDDIFHIYKDSDIFNFVETDFKFKLKSARTEDYKFFSVILSNDIDGDDLTYNKTETIEYYGFRRSYFRESILEKKYIITNERIYRFEEDSRKVLYMDIQKNESELINKLQNDGLYFERKQFIDFLNIVSQKMENITTVDGDYLNDSEVEKPELFCDIDEDENLVLNVKTGKNTSMVLLKGMSELSKLMNFKSVDAYLNNIISGFDANAAVGKDIDVIKASSEVCKIEKPSEIDRFLEDGISRYSKFSNVFLTDAIKSMNIPKRVGISVGIKVKSDLINIDFSSDELTKDEILNILKNYRKKKKFFRLKSGERIVIKDNELRELDNLVRDLNISDDELKKGKAKLPKYRMYQVESIENDDIRIEKDINFENVFSYKKININPKYDNILRDYQKTGVEWLLKLRSMNLCGILADDMGLGKTLQVISYFESIKSKKMSLIVTPASLILNWQSEFEKFNSGLKISTVLGDRIEREKIITNAKSDEKQPILITSYDYLKRDIDLYQGIDFDTIVIDEAQYIKNFKTKASTSVKSLEGDHRIALTGTPIENTLSEVWSIFDFLMKGYLFKYDYFCKNYEKPIVLDNNQKAKNKLKKMLDPFILRRLKKDVLKELPEKIEEVYYVDMNENERNTYLANLAQIHEGLQEKLEIGNNKIEILSMLTRLRQICIDQRLLYDNIDVVSSKIYSCMELIKKCIDNNQKILLFSSFTSVLDLIVSECEKENIEYYKLIGETDKIKRKKMVEQFQNNDVPLFLVSLKAGGTGLNLTSASVVIHIDPWWNIAAQNQATDRAYRIGQENNVQVFNFITKNTIEEKILKMQDAKKELSDLFVENSSGGFASLSKDELLGLFSLD